MRLDYVCGGIGLLPSFIAFQSSSLAGWIVFILAVAVFIFTARWESKRRTVVLDYDFEDKGERLQKKIVDKTWKHPNKIGGPDRRFKNNYQIPICLYGELRVKSGSGMDLYLMTSKNEAPQSFSAQFTSSCNPA